MQNDGARPTKALAPGLGTYAGARAVAYVPEGGVRTPFGPSGWVAWRCRRMGGALGSAV
jgi:hypothetical protein